ncbi:MAG: LPS assembly lipoprotein LptE [Candidatus Omnitrophota bacterium]|nr:LPS assembly lipoprotein LptE [Candidatus Omnitrophota bacterium]
MKTSIAKCAGILCLAFIFCAGGCGYTTRSLLPSNYKTLHVDNFKNSIPVTAEQNNVRMYRGYRPGMEIELTKAVIDKFLDDGNLAIHSDKGSDLILIGDMTDFRREALRYDTNDNVEEYRIKIIVDISLEDVKAGKTVWTEKGFTGETTYTTSGGLAKTEASAIKDAIADLARRVVERTVEAW